MSHVNLTIAVFMVTCFALAESYTWCAWGSCSSTCDGHQSRVCYCQISITGACKQGVIERRRCVNARCASPVNGQWSPWSAWSACSVTCGWGIQVRTRTCTNPPPSCCGRNCTGPSSQTRICYAGSCTTITTTPTTNNRESLMYVNSTDTTRCNARPVTCRTRQVCLQRCLHFCFYHERDFLIILDSSGSIHVPEYAEAKVDLAILATHLCGHIGCNLRVAAMHFSTSPHYEFGFDSHTTPAAVYSGIIGMGKEDSGTSTNLAFNFARLTMFTTINGHRPCAKKVALIVTDGWSNNRIAAIAAAQALKDSGVELFAVFIGGPGSPQYAEIRDYVSDPESSHVFSVSSVMELSTLADHIEAAHPHHCHCHCHCHHHCYCDHHCH